MFYKYTFKKHILLFAILAVQTAVFAQASERTIVRKNRLDELKRQIFEEPYTQLPRYQVTTKLFKRNQKSQPSNLLDDAKRTLRDNNDLLAPGRGQKLLQANGICFAGEWTINKGSEFTGLFKDASRVPILARASTTFSGTLQKERRAFGLAVKFLPEDLGDAASLNIFTLHSAGGVTQKYMLDLNVDNEPPLGRIPRFKDIATALKLKSTLLKADREAGSEKPSVTYRTVAPLAAYGEKGSVVAPRWVRFSAANKERVDQADFRDELRVENYADHQLIYNIDVGHHSSLKKSKATWQTIGKLTFTESVTSEACDTRLHFAHPRN